MLDAPFPPTCPADIAAYNADDVFEGYVFSDPDEPPPGGNRPAGYRWGLLNRVRDRQREDDGFDALRAAYLAEQRRAA